ncbi:MAG: HAD family hydrolase [Alphaproteobacteria bacterium]|nr:HAD family hydrolase [Alphaproteobacteria bacterium]
MPIPRAQGAILFDRDGTLNVDFDYVFRPDDLEWIEGAIRAVQLVNASGLLAIVVTNQSGVGRGYYSEADVDVFHARMSAELGLSGARIDAWYSCPFLPDAAIPAFAHRDHPDRKPNPGMVLRAIREHGLDPALCAIVGDKDRDIEAGRRAGVRGFLYSGGPLDAVVEQALSSCR